MPLALHDLMMVPCASLATCTPTLGFGLFSFTVANLLFTVSYLAIFVMIVIIRRKRRDIAIASWYRVVLLFVLAGAIAPIVRLYNLWQDDLLLAALTRLVPALITVATALALWQRLPKILGSASPVQMRETNEALRQEMEERRNAEAALLQSRKMEAVGRIAGGLAHEFNNMLQVISGNVRLIERKSGDGPAIAALAEAVQASVDRGVLLTGKLLSFSQEQNFLLEAVHIPDFIASLPDRIGSAIPPRITLEITSDNVEAHVLANRTQLELALVSIAENSAEAMPDGGGLRIDFARLRANDRHHLSDGDYLQITVADTGLGMDASVADRAFDPFFSTKPMGMASGLGLSTVYAMAQRSGGIATIDSRLGDGATVTLYLKLTELDTGTEDHRASMASDSFAGRTIMVVDDEDATRSVVALTLASLDCQVITAENGMQALSLTDQAWPDLFVLDYAMPTMTGVELAAKLRARNSTCCFMFLTGFADFAEIRSVVGTDVIILQKPVSRARLAEALTRAFASKSR